MVDYLSDHLSRLLSSGSGILSGYGPLVDDLNLFLVQAVIIIAMCRSIGIIGFYLKQPSVIFEIIGGIILGPSAIGRNAIYLNMIFPPKSLTYLKLVADLGLILYLFVVGMELDVAKLATHAQRAGGVALMGMAVPFALGIAISSTLYNTLEGGDPFYSNVSLTSFFVFIGTAMSITAFPVLARILKESGLIYSRAGALTMGAAALNDAVAWCLLILAICIANAKNMSIAGYVFLCVLAMAVGLFVIVRPIFKVLVVYFESFNNKAFRSNLFAFTICIVFLCAWTTALLGLDGIFGAFLFGLIVPRDTQLFHDCNEHIEAFVLTITLPLYFAISGLNTDITQISTSSEGAMVVLVCAVATGGKFLGAGSVAYFSGMTVRESWAVAFLMNTRGLIELIVLNLGLTANILNTKVFSVMVIMCLFTTFTTNPLIEYFYPPHLRQLTNTLVPEKEPLVEEDHELDIEKAIEINIELDTKDIVKLADNFTCGIVIDCLEHLQGIMDLATTLSPNASNQSLDVTITKFEEPSFTDKDQFIGLRDFDKRLIQVYRESTDINSLVHPDITKPLPTCLPLSMLCKAMGATVNAYDIRGDPLEFPGELFNLNSFENQSSHPIIIPWRSSQYLERLIWSALHIKHINICLYVQMAVEVPKLPEGRKRNKTISRNPFTIEEPIPHEVFEFSHSFRHTFRPISGSFHNRTMSMNHGSIPITVDRHKALTKIAVLITGLSSDINIFPFILRYAQKIYIELSILLTNDLPNYTTHISNSLTMLKSYLVNRPNCSFIQLDSNIYESINKLTSDVIAHVDKFHLFLCSYISPLYSSLSTVNLVTNIPFNRTNRSSSISVVIQSLLPAPELDVIHLRKSIGVPESFQESSLSHVELGILGDKLKAMESTSLPNLLIFHESILSNNKRRNSIELDASREMSNESSTKSVSMMTFPESKGVIASL